MKLGVNIDHVATLRQARQELFPDPVEAAKLALKGGADGIVVHLREDRRHIQKRDVFEIRKITTRFDLEMAAVEEMVKIALQVKPDYVTLVPEKREEITTEGGLDIKSKIKNQKSKIRIKSLIGELQEKNILVSLFVDPELEQIEASAKSGAKMIEIHTGAYAKAYLQNSPPKVKKELEKIKNSVKLARALGLKINAGHGLDYQNVKEIAAIDGIEELNIGFSIIARSIFAGIEQAVREMVSCISLV